MTGRALRSVLGVLLLGSAVAMPNAAAADDPVMCQGEVATIVGTDGPDVLAGTEGRDVIAALGGDDRITGLGGNDLICAGPGNDAVWGGAGDDRVFGEEGDDFLYGGSGDDRLFGSVGDDPIEGGLGSDEIVGGAGNDELWGSACVEVPSLGHFCRTPLSVEGVDPEERFAALLSGNRLLRAGSTGADVAALQELLAHLGFDPGSSDGVFGPATESAVRAFQLSRGPEADGVVGSQTRAALADALEASATAAPAAAAAEPGEVDLGTRLLQAGMSGADVAALQDLLAGLGFAPGPIDGVFGAGTGAAVRAFQSAHDLAADGVVGSQTKAALLAAASPDDSLTGGPGFDTCNSPDSGVGCESTRGLRSGGPWNAAAAEEWRPLITEAFLERAGLLVAEGKPEVAAVLEAEIDHAVAIVACESLGDPFITTPSIPLGAYVIGLFQHKDVYWAQRATQAGFPGASPLDPMANARVAAWLVARSLNQFANDPGVARPGWTHWVCDELLVDRGLWE
jgi:peptidoglycan hydrolase-like protein with peptidoglycan-binding domain